MAATGAKVFCTVRDMKKGESALADILKPGQVELVKMDLNSLDSVRAAARDVLFKTPPSPHLILPQHQKSQARPMPAPIVPNLESPYSMTHTAPTAPHRTYPAMKWREPTVRHRLLKASHKLGTKKQSGSGSSVHAMPFMHGRRIIAGPDGAARRK